MKTIGLQIIPFRQIVEISSRPNTPSGLTVSTILTLILIPVLYCVFASVGVKRKRKKHHERLLQGVKINSNN